MGKIVIYNTEHEIVKHLKPVNYRRLKKIIKLFSPNIPPDARIIALIYFYSKQDLWTDIYIDVGKGVNFYTTIHTFSME